MPNLDTTDMPDWVECKLDEMGSEVIDFAEGFIVCPGENLHTTPTGPNHCTVFHNADGSWVIYCHHQSCRDAVAAANAALRGARPGTRSKTNAALVRARRAKAQALAAKRALYANSLPDILRDHVWPYAQIVADSPKPVGPIADHWRNIMGLFTSGDIVWCGDVKMSGQPYHHVCFEPVANWLREFDECPANFTCPSTFAPGTYSRCGKAVKTRPYLVVESDLLSKNEIGAIFRWLMSGGMNLRAVVDTGGKSLHGWFEFPQPSRLAELEVALPALRCDPKMFGPSQPCRLPGVLRDETGRHQCLIYLD